MSNDSNKEYSVNWKNHMSHVRKAFDHLLNTNELTDVTLYCEGKKIGAHKMLLSACSAYFRDTFKEVPCQHPVIVMYGVEYNVLSDILHFIYRGEVSVDNSKLDTFLKTAQLLQISGLSDDPSERLISENDQTTEVLNSNEREDSYNIQSPIQASSVSDEHKSTTVGTKRLKSNEVVDAPREKVQRSGNDTVFISDVKCEPSELANFEDPLEDPLLQPDQTGETKEYVVAGGIHTEEEFKRPVVVSEEQSNNDLPFLSKIKPRKRLSAVFEYKVVANFKYGKCLLCQAQKIEKLVKMKNSNTTGLKRHLETHHKHKFLELYGEEPSRNRRNTEIHFLQSSVI